MSDDEIKRKLKELRSSNGSDKPKGDDKANGAADSAKPNKTVHTTSTGAPAAATVTTKPNGKDAGIIPVNLSSRSVMHASYMPFLKNSGVFVPLSKKYKLGEEVFLLLTIKGQPDTIPVAGKVAWVNPKGVQGHRPRGIGVEFNAKDGPELRKKIEKYLGDALRAKNATYTM